MMKSNWQIVRSRVVIALGTVVFALVVIVVITKLVASETVLMRMEVMPGSEISTVAKLIQSDVFLSNVRRELGLSSSAEPTELTIPVLHARRHNNITTMERVLVELNGVRAEHDNKKGQIVLHVYTRMRLADSDTWLRTFGSKRAVLAKTPEFRRLLQKAIENALLEILDERLSETIRTQTRTLAHERDELISTLDRLQWDLINLSRALDVPPDIDIEMLNAPRLRAKEIEYLAERRRQLVSERNALRDEHLNGDAALTDDAAKAQWNSYNIAIDIIDSLHESMAPTTSPHEEREMLAMFRSLRKEIDDNEKRMREVESRKRTILNEIGVSQPRFHIIEVN